MHLRTLTAVVLTLALLATGIGAASPGLGKYQDVDRALADGYINTGQCVPGMGIHFVNPALLDDDVTVSEGEVLVYAYNAEDELELVAVEYVAPSEFELLGDHAHFNPHLGAYALHGWFFLPNSDGLTAEFNPRIDAACNIS